MMSYRLFIAAELPPAVKQALAQAQELLRRDRPPVRWGAPEAMHLTLRFLGDTPAEQIPAIEQAMRDGLAGHAPMTLRLRGLGAFPNARRPSVVWAGVGGDTAALERAQAALEAGLAAIGMPAEPRPFRAHLTLGRVRRDAPATQVERLGAAIQAAPPFPALEWPVERAILFRSELRAEGPIYTELVERRL
jgi:2'-5' RNA ligase